MTTQSANFGQLLRRERLVRGWSQRYLADRAGLHSSTVSRIEGGQRTGHNTEVLARLLTALGLPTVDFDRGQRRQAEATNRSVRGLRALLIDGSAEPVPAGPASPADRHVLRRLRTAGRYREALLLLPGSVAGLGRAAEHGLTELVHVLFDASFVLWGTDHAATAWIAAERCVAVADSSGDPCLRMAAALARSYAAARNHAPAQGVRGASEALALYRPGCPESAALTGMLHLVTAVHLARLRATAGCPEADYHLAAARLLVDEAAGAADPFDIAFGAVTVGLASTRVALELGDLPRASASVASAPPGREAPPDQRSYHHLCLAEVLADDHPVEAARHLLRAEQCCPQFLRGTQQAGSLATTLMGARLGPRERHRLRSLCDRLDVLEPHW